MNTTKRVRSWNGMRWELDRVMMKRATIRQTGAWLCGCLILYLLAGCANDAQTPTPLPTPTATPAPSVEDDPALTPALELAADVQAAIAAMERLSSYRTSTRYDFSETTGAGVTTSGSLTVTVEYVRTPQEAQRIVMDGSGLGAENGEAGRMQAIRIGDVVWTDLGDGNWLQSSEEAGAPFQSAGLIYDSPELLVGASQAHKVGVETVNGQASDHYLFDQQQMRIADIGEMDAVQGEFWLAQDGGFIVRYRLEAHGADVELSQGQRGQGTIRLFYDVPETNQPLAITPPEMPAGPPGFATGGFPLPAGARTVLTSRSFASYLATPPPAEVIQFYQEALPALGWSLLPAEGFASEEMTSLVFQKGAEKIALSILADDETGLTQILVSAETEP